MGPRQGADIEMIGQMLLLGRGMCSDDTEHSCMVAQAVAMLVIRPRP